MSFELFIGRRYLRAKQKQAFISIITVLSVAGVTVGVMALIVVIAVMAGFESDLKSRILGVESHLILSRSNGNLADFNKILDDLKNVAGIKGATPFVNGQIMLRSDTRVAGAKLRGIEPNSAGQVLLNLNPADLEQVEPLSQKHALLPRLPGIILGRELARVLGVVKGDRIYLISPRGSIAPTGHLPVLKRFIITGFFATGMYEYDGSLAYINLKEAQKLLRIKDGVSGIEIRLSDIYLAKKMGEKLIDLFGPQYQVKDWMQMNKSLFSALKLEKAVMFIILSLIIMVAAFNITSSLIMMVMEKTKDIAILKAMGATKKSIGKIFIFKGLAIGMSGTIFGVGSGVLLCWLLKKYEFIKLPGDVYYITTLPVLLQTIDVILIGLAAIAICFLATIYPARQAAGLDPVEALRYG